MREQQRILLIEDEILISSGIRRLLAQYGYDCVVVDSGEAAIEQLPDFPPDLVLMDIGLKGKLDGLSTAAIIRQQSKVPIIYISDQSSWNIFQLAKQTGAANYLTKPFSDGELCNAVELALSQAPQLVTLDAGPPPGDRVSDGFFIFAEGAHKKVLFADILFIQADGMYTLLYCTEDRTYRVALSSNNVMLQVNWPGFVKTSKSNYVNIHKVDGIKSDELEVGPYSVTLSKTYKEDFLTRIQKLKQK